MACPPPPPTVKVEEHPLGQGSTGRIFRAVVESSGKTIAVKQSRVSLRVARPYLQHEVRLLHLLQGHRAIPELFGYYRGPHFEYIAMELLGANLDDHLAGADGFMEPEGLALREETVANVGVQLLSALQHLLDKGVVHRDVKPSNILLCPTDPSAVRLVDYGCSSLIDVVRPRDPRAAAIVGTLRYCSIGVHDGHWPLQPSDDLDSLLYTLLFLLGGSLPWDYLGASASKPACVEYVAAMKRTLSMDASESPLATELGRLLPSPKPDYSTLVARLQAWITPNPVDWSPVPPPPALRRLLVATDGPDGPYSYGTAPSRRLPDSNRLLAMSAEWLPRAERLDDLTVPGPVGEACDVAIPSFYVALPEYAQHGPCSSSDTAPATS
ncbi:Kinase-like protein [Mycena kentingensis (nom. inval.)]|nr:Kinase-like protein [Mycena kentingensis (nom. inval.)]